MDLKRLYYDTHGNQCNIMKLINREPEWAANMIQHYEEVIARERESVQRLEAEVAKLKQGIRYPHIDCFYNGGCGCNNLRLGVEPKEAAKKAMEDTDGRP